MCFCEVGLFLHTFVFLCVCVCVCVCVCAGTLSPHTGPLLWTLTTRQRATKGATKGATKLSSTTMCNTCARRNRPCSTGRPLLLCCSLLVSAQCSTQGRGAAPPPPPHPPPPSSSSSAPASLASLSHCCLGLGCVDVGCKNCRQKTDG